MLSSVNPSQAQGREVTVRDALDAAAKRIDEGAMKAQPEVEVAVRNAIGTTYDGLGLLDAGERQLRSALEVQSRTSGNRLVLAETHAKLAALDHHAAKWTEMAAEAREALRLRREVLGPRHADVASSLDDLGAALLYEENLAEAEPLLREALAVRREVLPPDQIRTSRCPWNNVAFVVKSKGSLAEAETMFREALDIDRRRLGNEHPEVATKLVNVTLVLQDQRKWQEAEPFAREAVAIRRKVLGPDHPALANALDQRQAISVRRAVGKRRKLPSEKLWPSPCALSGRGHRETARLQNNLAWALYGNGAHAEAESLFRKALPALRKTQGVSAPFTRIASNGLAYALYGLRDYRAAESAARESLALWRQYPNDRSVVGARNVLGASLVAQRRFKEAEPLLREAQDIYAKSTTPIRTHWYRPDMQSTLGAALAGLKEFGEPGPTAPFGLRRVAGFAGRACRTFAHGDGATRGVLRCERSSRTGCRVAQQAETV